MTEVRAFLPKGAGLKPEPAAKEALDAQPKDGITIQLFARSHARHFFLCQTMTLSSPAASMEADATPTSVDIFAMLCKMFCSNEQFDQLAESCHGLSEAHVRLFGIIGDFNAVTEARLNSTNRQIDHLKDRIASIEAKLNSAYNPHPLSRNGIEALKRRAHFAEMSMEQYLHSPVGDSEAKLIICSDGYVVFRSWDKFYKRKNDGPPLFNDVVGDYICCYFHKNVSDRVVSALLSGEDIAPEDDIIRNCAIYFANYVVATWKKLFKPQLGQLGKRSASDALSRQKPPGKRQKPGPSEIGGTTESDEAKFPSSQQSNAGSSVQSLPDTEIVPRTPDKSADGDDENAMGVKGDAAVDDMPATQLPGSPTASEATEFNTSREFVPQFRTEDEKAGAKDEKGGASLLIAPAKAGDKTFGLLPTNALGGDDVDGSPSPTRPAPILTPGRLAAPQKKPISLDSGNPGSGTTSWGIGELMRPPAADRGIR